MTERPAEPSDPAAVDRFRRLEVLFLEAIARPPEERRAFLDAQRAIDAESRAEVERWLAAHDTAESRFLRFPTAGASGEPAASDLAGRRVGRYRIERLLAAGGMGVVYEATQEAPHRAVAIKLMRRGLATPAERRRFELEAEILGRIRHPAVAQVLEAGTHVEGDALIPWFALELVQGARSITQYATEQRLEERERLELLAQVCDAVHHGHQKGVIHRDLKPSNVLVDASGRPKVIDFGIARVCDPDLALTTRLTSERTLVGTLEYMSPEQCTGDARDVDVRSDVYSLGVLLYELMCGVLPHSLEDKPLPEGLRIVREEPPRRPSSVRRGIPRDVEAIILKAMAKERDRRYGAASELSADVRRFLRGEPVAARLPSVSYGLILFARRHRALVGALAAVFVVLIAGVIVSGAFAIQAHRQALVAGRARDALAREREDVLRMGGFLRSILAEGDPFQASPSTLVSELLDDAVARLDREFADRPKLQAPLRVTLGRAYVNLARYEEGERQLEVALGFLEGNDAETQRLRVEALNALGKARLRRVKPAEAKVAVEESIRLAEALGDPDAMLQAKGYLGSALLDLGALEEAEALDREVLAARRRRSPQIPLEIAESASNLASVLYHRGHGSDAEKLWSEAAELYRAADQAQHPNLATILGNLSLAQLQAGHLDSAAASAREAVEIHRTRLGPDHPDLANALEKLGLVERDKGNYRDAEASVRECLRIRRLVHGDDHPRVAQALTNLAFVLLADGRNREAVEPLEQALAIQARTLAPEHLDVAGTSLLLGIALTRASEPQRAEAHLRLSVRIRARLGEEHWSYHNARSALGECLAALGRDGEAESLLVDSEARIRAALGAQHSQSREARQRLADFYARRGREADAARYREGG